MPFIGNLGPTELIIILVIALVILGPGKLPEVGSALGKSIREFRKAATDVKDATSFEPARPDVAPPPVAQAPVVPASAPVAPPVTSPAVDAPTSSSGPEAPAS